MDGALTAGILWLDVCREKESRRRHFGGLKVIVPAGASRTTAGRMAWLNHDRAHFQLDDYLASSGTFRKLLKRNCLSS